MINISDGEATVTEGITRGSSDTKLMTTTRTQTSAANIILSPKVPPYHHRNIPHLRNLHHSCHHQHAEEDNNDLTQTALGEISRTLPLFWNSL